MPADDISGLSTAPTEIFEKDGRPVTIARTKMRLVAVSGEDKGKEVEIGQELITGGSFKGCDFVLTDPTVSRLHFEIRTQDDGFVLSDLGSTNGTFVDGYRVGRIFLKPNTLFEAAGTSIRFEPLDERVEVDLSEHTRFGDTLGTSVRMREVFGLLEKVAPTDLTVLIQGETGTGKEVVARSIHLESKRAASPFIVVDCGALPTNLIESELFGHKKGAFTGATESRRGAFEMAHHGTVFLDEIGELPLALQPKLLRVLEDREVRRVGGEKVMKLDVRVLAATNRDLSRMVAEDTFREDLFFRLAVAQVRLPALRDRLDDIPMLVEGFLDKLTERIGDDKKFIGMTERAIEVLGAHHWPGNVRELRNTIERAVFLSETGRVDVGGVRLDPRGAVTPVLPQPRDFEIPFKEAKSRLVDAFERAYLVDLLSRHEGNISASARVAGIERKHLKTLLRKHGLVSEE